MNADDYNFQGETTAAGRLDLLGRFLDHWFGRRWPDFCEPDARLDAQPLPAPLRQFYAMAGRRPSAAPDSLELFYTGSGGHHLRDLDAVETTDDGKLDVFMEYQGDWSGLTLPEGDDPPVWLRGCFEGIEDETTLRATDSLSSLLVTHCLMTILYEYENAPCALTARTGPLLDRFHDPRDPAIKIWDTTGLNWPTSCLPYRGEFFLIPFTDGILVRRDGPDHRFASLRPGAISVMLGDLLRGPHT